MSWDIACLLPSSTLCVYTLKSGFPSCTVNPKRARLCFILSSYLLLELDQNGTHSNCAIYLWIKLMGKYLCSYLCPEKLFFIMGCNCNHKEIRASLVLESFSEESFILGKNHLPGPQRISHWTCFCVLDSGKDAASLASPPTSGHLTTDFLEAIWWDLVFSVQDPLRVCCLHLQIEKQPLCLSAHLVLLGWLEIFMHVSLIVWSYLYELCKKTYIL